MKYVKFNYSKGFTLVELMVVVAIIGILSAVAIPNFKRYQAKSKTTEAKLELAALYTAEQSWMSDYDTFASCLWSMGSTQSILAGSAQPNHYFIGFSAKNPVTQANSISNGATSCTDTHYWRNKQILIVGGKQASFQDSGTEVSVRGANTTVGGLAYVSDEGDTFVAAAAGFIDADKATAPAEDDGTDQWTIDQDKVLTHVKEGW